ncbi:ABC transporter ATP-binding protein [Defluviitalea saccharophila]|uniref:ABC transporter ATP-binding protein n=1 Tax=Defluviitalea saccharophila TaxID=879970 RepID=A0ABZ2Y5U2_9FIRM|nr:ABC transporter ATP-binding protein [Candidatus Epulonipiscium sp.]
MLTVNGINVYYGAIHAIKDVSFHVGDGEIVTLIGANGAGKTTILHTISGLLRTKTGDIKFLDNPINKVEPHEILKMGIAHVPEGRRIFSQMTVLENLQMGAYTRTNKEETNNMIEMVFEKFPRLKERVNQLAGTMSGGEQQMLAIGRALMSKPKLLLMDEPSMGLAPILVQEIFNIIQEINSAGTTILLVEQNANMALSIANRAYVLETGKVVLEGNAKELLGNENVRKAYLG